ncbi:MAG: isoleucine--tRNA ligase [Candidatus Micrarchaeia archaeon]
MDMKAYEDSVLRYWIENNVNRSVRQKNGGGKKFYFLDGPPYASGEPGFYHAWVVVTKDLVLRYKRYRGFDVHDRAGFDVHGLPIEVKVEKQLNLTSKKDIQERVGVGNFIEKCKSFADEQVRLAIGTFTRYGTSADFQSVYIPHRKEYIEKGWAIFKKIYEKKLVYEGKEPLAYCPHCETVLSQGPEIEYGTETDPSIFIKFKIQQGTSNVSLPENTFLVVWTTTPWTLVSNVSIAANPKELYVVASTGSENLVVAKSRLDEFAAAVGVNLVVKEEFYGSELKGTQYEGLFGNDVPAQTKISQYHIVITSESFVSASEGTGLLHVAPGHGPEDFKLGKEYKMPMLSPIDEHARYTAETGIFANLSVPVEANQAVLDYLKKSGALMFQGVVSHSYPHCWRCGSKLIYRATKQYYINVDKIRGKMLDQNKKVKWYPSYASEWFDDAIKSSPDWCISRQRYWGIPIPLWKCEKCGNEKVIGSAKELAELSGQKKELYDLHRQHVDEITIRCEKCGGTMRRIPDIFDVWYDSGIAHTASLSDEEFKKLFPADWISEGLDQLRGWFTTLLRTSVALYGRTPFLSVSIGGMVKDEMGQEMHRHLGNVVSANEILEMSTADAFRLWSLSHPRWEELRLKKAELVEANSNMITIYNVAELANELFQRAGIDAKVVSKPPARLELEELWIVSKLNSLILHSTEHLDRYELDAMTKDVKEFMLEDMSRFYLRFAKQRVEPWSSARQVKRVATLLAYLLRNALVVSSVVIPFAAEHIYQQLFSNGESIFMNQWPKAAKGKINSSIEEKFKLLKAICNAALFVREQRGVKLRWPVSEVIVKTNDEFVLEAVSELAPFIEMYANAKKLAASGAETSKKLIKPVFAKLGPDFKADAQMVAEELARQDAETVSNEVASSGFYALHTGKGVYNIKPEHFVVVENTAAESGTTVHYNNASVIVDINAEMTSDLYGEVVKREFIRRIQMMRKEMKLSKLEKVDVYAKMPAKFAELLAVHIDEIKGAAGIRRAKFNADTPKSAYEKSWDILNEDFIIALDKVGATN